MLYKQSLLNILYTITSLLSKVVHPVSPLISSFLPFTTSQSHIHISFCFTSISLHSLWDHTCAPHPHINLFTTKPLPPSLPYNYIIPDLPFCYFIHTFKTTIMTSFYCCCCCCSLFSLVHLSLVLLLHYSDGVTVVG